MQYEMIVKSEMKLVGLAVRTNNKSEMNPQEAKISAVLAQYWGQGMAAQIAERKQPGVTLAVYTDYASDEHGDYTYFLGEEVNAFDHIPEGLVALTIPAAAYQKFTTPTGPLPAVVIQAWQAIWQMDFAGKRTYVADFEVYDQRASDPAKASLDICIGIK